MIMDTLPTTDKPARFSFHKKTNKATAVLPDVVENQLEHGQSYNVGKTAQCSGGSIDKEKLEADLREMERLVGLDQVLEARVVVDKIQNALNDKNNNNNNQCMISDKRREMIDDVIVESNDANKLLHDMDNDDGWTLASHKKNIIIHYRNEPESPLQSVKLETIFENFTSLDFVRLIALFNEAEYLPDWFPKGVIKECILLAEPGKYTRVVQFFMSFGILPLSPRDAVQIGKGYYLPKRNAALIVAKSISECRHCEVPPPDKGYVRVDSFAAFYIQLMPNNRVLFRQISHDDMKLKHIPPVLINYLARGGMPYEVVNAMRKHIANFEGSVWDKRIQEKKEYYKEIEDRVIEVKLKVSEEKKKAKRKDGGVTWASTVSSTRSVEIVAAQDSTTASRVVSSRRMTKKFHIPYILNQGGSNSFIILLPLVVVAWVLYVVFQPSIHIEQPWQKDEISYPEHYVLPVLFLLGCAMPVVLKTTPANPNSGKTDQGIRRSSSTGTTGNPSTTSKPSSSVVESDDSYYDASGESLVSSPLSDNDSEHSGNMTKQSHHSKRKMHSARKSISKAGRLVGRVLPVHKIKKNTKRKTPKEADSSPS